MRLIKYFYLILYINSYVSFAYFVQPILLSTIAYANINSILILHVTNFKDWKQNVLIVLGCMDLDLALRIYQPPPLTTDSFTKAKKEFKR